MVAHLRAADPHRRIYCNSIRRACEAIAAVWPRAERLAHQSWEANQRTNSYEVAGSADPLTGLAVGSLPVNFSASWSPCSPCRTCYSAPNICSSKPWWQLSLPRRVNDEQWDLVSPEFCTGLGFDPDG